MMSKSLKSLLIATFLLTSFSSFADSSNRNIISDPALELKSVEVIEVESFLDNVELPTDPTDSANPIGEISMIVDGLFSIGKKIWSVVDAGRPVISNKLAPAVSVLPHLEGENGVLNLMENWSIPKVKSYRVAFKNSFGSEVVTFVYTVLYQYGGDLDGVGKYITGLKVQASQIHAAWGFNFDATSELVSIANVGSKKAPVASAVVQIAYAVKGLINESRVAQSFYIDGNGNFQVLNN